MDDQIITDFDYIPDQKTDYKKRFMDFLTRWCATCQNREPMTLADKAANELGMEMQELIDEYSIRKE